ncbi:hypothetical protein L1887_55597 [Cichorium endivia]|nr:hypothetical protein L1887_55597 [Cichorium endivia]
MLLLSASVCGCGAKCVAEALVQLHSADPDSARGFVHVETLAAVVETRLTRLAPLTHSRGARSITCPQSLHSESNGKQILRKGGDKFKQTHTTRQGKTGSGMQAPL